MDAPADLSHRRATFLRPFSFEASLLIRLLYLNLGNYIHQFQLTIIVELKTF